MDINFNRSILNGISAPTDALSNLAAHACRPALLLPAASRRPRAHPRIPVCCRARLRFRLFRRMHRNRGLHQQTVQPPLERRLEP